MSAGFRGSGPLGLRTLQRVLKNLRAGVGPAKCAMPLWRFFHPAFFRYPRCPPHPNARLRRTFYAGPYFKWPGVWVWVKPRKWTPTSSLFTIHSYFGGPQAACRACRAKKWETPDGASPYDMLIGVIPLYLLNSFSVHTRHFHRKHALFTVDFVNWVYKELLDTSLISTLECPTFS